MATNIRNNRINLGKLCSKLSTLTPQVEFLQSVNILPTTIQCSQCDVSLVKWKAEGQKVYFRSAACKAKTNIRQGTLLYMSKISFRRFVLLAYCFTNSEMTYPMIQNETSMTSDEEDDMDCSMKTSSNTIAKYFELFRESVNNNLIK